MLSDPCGIGSKTVTLLEESVKAKARTFCMPNIN